MLAALLTSLCSRGERGCELWTDSAKICYAGKLHGRYGGRPGYAPSFNAVITFPDRMRAAANCPDLKNQPRASKPWLENQAKRDWRNASSLVVAYETTSANAEFSTWLRTEKSLPSPPNLWAGTSVTTQSNVSRVEQLVNVGDHSTTRFASLEPPGGSIDSRSRRQAAWRQRRRSASPAGCHSSEEDSALYAKLPQN